MILNAANFLGLLSILKRINGITAIASEKRIEATKRKR
jgi:hypothetical protein